jgi:hypothetical protein
MFGDPDDGQTLANGLSSRSLTFCAQGDVICQGGDLITPAHLSYGAVSKESFLHTFPFFRDIFFRC